MPEDTQLAQTQDDIRAPQALPDSPDRRARGAAARHEPARCCRPGQHTDQKSAARLAFKQARALAGELDRSPTTRHTDNALRISLDVV